MDAASYTGPERRRIPRPSRLASRVAGDAESRPQVRGHAGHSADRGHLRVMTLNVAHARRDGLSLFRTGSGARAALDAVAGVLCREAADLVALQEADGPSMWSGGFSHVEYLARQAAMPCHIHGEHVRAPRLSYGTALLSRLPLRDPLSVTFVPSLPLPKGFLLGTVDWPGGGPAVDVVSVHLDYARGRVRTRQVDELAERLSERRRPAIVMGDFNCGWQAPGSAVRRLAEAMGFHTHAPEGAAMATFPFTDRRLDWILASPELAFRRYAVLPDAVSDHRAVVAELALAN